MENYNEDTDEELWEWVQVEKEECDTMDLRSVVSEITYTGNTVMQVREVSEIPGPAKGIEVLFRNAWGTRGLGAGGGSCSGRVACGVAWGEWGRWARRALYHCWWEELNPRVAVGEWALGAMLEVVFHISA